VALERFLELTSELGLILEGVEEKEWVLEKGLDLILVLEMELGLGFD
jgi:hypothetical protein